MSYPCCIQEVEALVEWCEWSKELPCQDTQQGHAEDANSATHKNRSDLSKHTTTYLIKFYANQAQDNAEKVLPAHEDGVCPYSSRGTCLVEVVLIPCLAFQCRDYQKLVSQTDRLMLPCLGGSRLVQGKW